MSYIIEIKSRDGSDLFSIKTEHRKKIDFLNNEKYEDKDTFQHSVIVFNENIEDGECMVIANNITQLIRLKEITEENVHNIVKNEIDRTILALELLEYKYKDLIVIILAKMDKKIDPKNVYGNVNEEFYQKIHKTTKIYHLN